MRDGPGHGGLELHPEDPGKPDEEVGSSADVQLEALVSLLTDALQADPSTDGRSLAVE